MTLNGCYKVLALTGHWNIDVETQVITDTEIMDSIQSCEEPNAADMIEDSVTPKKKKTKPEIVDRGLDCYCGISVSCAINTNTKFNLLYSVLE